MFVPPHNLVCLLASLEPSPVPLAQWLVVPGWQPGVKAGEPERGHARRVRQSCTGLLSFLDRSLVLQSPLALHGHQIGGNLSRTQSQSPKNQAQRALSNGSW